MITPIWFRTPDSLSGMPADTPVLVGFSGGADSCALLYLLKEYSKQTGAKIYAAHVEHGIRGDEALRDRDFCREIAKSLDIPFFTESFDVPSMVKSGDSLEGVGRRVRYEWFAKLMNEYSIPLLALAHHADDNLETVIFNLLRGSGSKGMCGILPSRKMDTVSDGLVIRPLINASKTEILSFCRENKIEFVTDSTNAEDDCSRNLIRHRIIPELEKIRDNPQKSATRMTQILAEDCQALDGIAENILDGQNSISLEVLNAQPPAIAKRIISLLCRRYVKELSHENICSVLELAKSGHNNSQINLQSGAYAITEYGRLAIHREIADVKHYDIALEYGFNNLGNGIAVVLTDGEKPAPEYNGFIKTASADIDKAKISGNITASERRDGDAVNTMGMTKSLKKLFCERRVYKGLRDIIPIIRDEDGVLLVPGCAVKTGAERKPEGGFVNISVYFSRELFKEYNMIKSI